jgi:hypothetical protein
MSLKVMQIYTSLFSGVSKHELSVFESLVHYSTENVRSVYEILSVKYFKL